MSSHLPGREGGKGSAGMCNVSCVQVWKRMRHQPDRSVGLEEMYLHHGVPLLFW